MILGSGWFGVAGDDGVWCLDGAGMWVMLGSGWSWDVDEWTMLGFGWSWDVCHAEVWVVWKFGSYRIRAALGF